MKGYEELSIILFYFIHFLQSIRCDQWYYFTLFHLISFYLVRLWASKPSSQALSCTGCTVLYGAELECNVLCWAVLSRVVLYCTVLCSAVPYCAVRCWAVVRCAVLCCYSVQCSVVYCTVVHCSILYCDMHAVWQSIMDKDWKKESRWRPLLSYTILCCAVSNGLRRGHHREREGEC